MMAVKKKTLHGFGWSFADNLGNQMVTFCVTLVLARLLTPSDFGMIAMITVFTAIANTFIDSGFSTALIRKLNCTQRDYSTVFYFNISIGLLLFSVLFLAAPALSRFYEYPELEAITRTISLVVIIGSFSVIQRIILTKNIDFRRQAKVSLISAIASGILGISMALWGFGVWSLVGQVLSRQLFQSILLWVFSSWRPSLIFSVKSFRELFGFGSKILASSLIDTLYKNINSLVIGKFFSSATLGYYTNADKFQSVFSTNLTQTIQRVSFPVLSSFQKDELKIKNAYKKLLINTMIVTFALMLGLAAVAESVVILSMGKQWEQVIPYLQLLCFSGMFYPLHAINLNIINVKGSPGDFLKLEVIKKIVAVPVLVAGILWGVYVLLFGMIAISILSFFLNSYYSDELIGYSTREQLADIAKPLGISMLVAILMWLITLLHWNLLGTLLLQVGVGLVFAYVLYSYSGMDEFNELKLMAAGFSKKWIKKILNK